MRWEGAYLSASSCRDGGDACAVGMGAEGMKPVAMPEDILMSTSAACTDIAGPGGAAPAGDRRCAVLARACTCEVSCHCISGSTTCRSGGLTPCRHHSWPEWEICSALISLTH